ncbi:MAG: hypothetical protein IJ647_01765 [Prevotella sp.]|nr:hypothetical protein [Prevotella sp.]
MNFSFVRNDQHLLKTKLPAVQRNGIVRYALVGVNCSNSGKKQQCRNSNALALFEHFQIGHVPRHTPDSHLAMEGTERSVGFVTKPTETDSSFKKK